MLVPVHHKIGNLPQPQTRSVVFFANLQSIFFGQQEETQLLADTVNGIDSYGGRLVPILQFLYPGTDNLLVLERRPAPELLAWYHEVLDLRTPQLLALGHDAYCDPGHADTLAVAMQAQSHPADWLDGYVTDARLCQIAESTGKKTRSAPGASQAGNNKLLLHRHLAASGLPTFRTIEAETPKAIAAALLQLNREGYQHACLKAAIGASGIGLLKLPTTEPPPPLPEFYCRPWPCLVQGWEDASRDAIASVESPSVQLWLDDDAVTAYDLTNQILSSASIHEGNSAPPPWQRSAPELVREIFRQTDITARWLHQTGYRGAASIDFHLAWETRRKAPTVRVCEINARVTGATYPSILARHFLPHGAWRMQNLHFPTPLACGELLAAINNSGHAFRPGAPGGLVPINVNLRPDGLVQKCQMLALGRDLENCTISTHKLETALPVEYVHDRD